MLILRQLRVFVMSILQNTNSCGVRYLLLTMGFAGGRKGLKACFNDIDMAIVWQHYGNKKVSAAIMLSLDFLLDNRA